MGSRSTEGDREVSDLTDILDEVFASEVPHVDSAIVGWLSVSHPELLREALDTVTHYARERENRP